MSNQKKSEELWWLKRFQVKAGLEFEILDCDRESPDFLINVDGRRVGIEVTELHIDQSQIDSDGGSSLHRIHSIEQEIIARAQREYSKTSSRPIHAKFDFDSNCQLQGINRRDMAKSIVDVLCKLNVGDMEKCRIDQHSTPSSPHFVSVIYVRGMPEQSKSPWLQINPSWVKILEPCDVKPILAQKNENIDQYRNTACENWLLICANGWWPHGRFSPPAEGEFELPDSEFERTYVLCEPDRFLIRLKEHGRIQEINPRIT